MPPALRLATRGSPLALRQVDEVARRLSPFSIAVEPFVVRTAGDRLAEAPLHLIGGQGVFVREVQEAVLSGRAEVALHSAKDMPPESPPGLVLACVPERADPRDVLVGGRLSELLPGATVATGSPRRRAQLANLRPDLTFAELRGNIGTRLARVGQGGIAAVVTAAAALERLDLLAPLMAQPEGTFEVLPPSWLLPQIGQGALGLEARQEDVTTQELLAVVDDPLSHRALRAERAVLSGLGAGCNTPCAALAQDDGSRTQVTALLASGDGRVVVRAGARDDDPERAGSAALEALLEEHGGRALL